jgi:hypothetical protein
MGVLTLAGTQGSKLLVEAVGEDAERAVRAIEKLIDKPLQRSRVRLNPPRLSVIEVRLKFRMSNRPLEVAPMAGKDFLFTSESVSEGHPDKLCDQVSDAILDAHLAGDPNSRVACESLAKTGMVVVAGEITSATKVSYADIVRDVVREIGYTDSAMGFDGNTCAILTASGPAIARYLPGRNGRAGAS